MRLQAQSEFLGHQTAPISTEWGTQGLFMSTQGAGEQGDQWNCICSALYAEGLIKALLPSPSQPSSRPGRRLSLPALSQSKKSFQDTLILLQSTKSSQKRLPVHL